MKSCPVSIRILLLTAAASSLPLASTGASIPFLALLGAEPPAAAPDCEDLHRRIAASHQGLPADFRDLSQEAITKIGGDVETAVGLCRKFLESCPKGPLAAEVHYYLAKNLYLLSARHRNAVHEELKQQPSGKVDIEELRRRLQAYHETIASHARQSYEGLEKGKALKPQALQLLAQARSEAGDNLGAGSTYEEFLTLFPEDAAIGSVVTSLARCYLQLEQYDRGAELLRKYQKHPRVYDSASFPYVGEMMWKLQEAKGSLEGMLEATAAADLLYPLRLKEPGLRASVREDYERHSIFNGFRRGYTLFAQGKIDEARQAFQAYSADLSGRDAKARTGGGQLPPYARIYLKRAQDCLAFIDERIGRPGPADIDLAHLWVTDRRISLQDAKDKVLAVVFRSTGDERSRSFLESVDGLCAEDPDLELVTVSFLKGRPSDSDIAKQVEELREELGQIDYRGAAGFDPDAERKSLFRVYKANVGSATFIAFDRDGNLAWFQQDPRAVDANLARTILLRLKDRK